MSRGMYKSLHVSEHDKRAAGCSSGYSSSVVKSNFTGILNIQIPPEAND